MSVQLAHGVTMSADVDHCTVASATGGRYGEARAQDGNLLIKLSTPKELGGAGGRGAILSTCLPPADRPVSSAPSRSPASS